MKIEHIAIYSKDIEKLKEFYQRYFGARSNDKYINERKEFQSYFLSFEDGARIEIMEIPNLNEKDNLNYTGLAHFAVSVGSREEVDRLADAIRKDGYKVIGEPRTTGDGYYESVVEDADGNKIEITI